MRRSPGILGVAFYAIHAAVHLARGEPYDLLWGCHVAALLVGAGLMFRNATLNAVGLLWSCFGLPLWLLYTFTGGEFMPTATLTHVGGVVLGVYGVTVMGLPAGSAWKALTSYLELWAVTRAMTPASANVNLAFHVHPGWEDRFPTYALYFATLFAAAALSFAVCEFAFRLIPIRDRRPQVSV